jgi:TrmH family RNA methyltransferase
MNLGYMARVAKNFGVGRICLVNPRANPKGNKSVMFSKHARDLLENANIAKSFRRAIADCDVVVGTSGVKEKARSGFSEVLTPSGATRRLRSMERGAGGKDMEVGVVIGRDDIGLTKDEIAMCDFMVHVPTNPAYPVLNISHALAILLYAFAEAGAKPVDQKERHERANRKELMYLFDVFDASLKGKRIRDKKAVSRIFRRMVSNARPSEQEIHALISAIK